eukprot:TRINITY_DN115773_c0_g1_i1.p1 TRINITY_DN115773_c0_g1~~TRINITY_DN115773_c0_g1_i1.p1  ORF type:complete len:433 (+),score=77.84 TRINITY_DN115773_c0_g1_i1:62-1300(+)
MARQDVSSLISEVGLCLPLLRGEKKILFEGSHGFIGKEVSSAYAGERCTVKKYHPQKKRWQVSLIAERFKDQQVLVPEKDITFDYFICPTAYLSVMPSNLEVVNVGAAGNALFCTEDLPANKVVLRENPFLVIGGTLSFSSCWTCFHMAQTELGADHPVIHSFNELSDGDLSQKFLGAAAILTKNMLISAPERIRKHLESPAGKEFQKQEIKKISGVLARWMSNSHNFSLAQSNETCSALYRNTAKMLHSCEPNCCAIIDADTGEMNIKTTKKIKKGCQLTICYLGEDPDFSSATVEERRQKLAPKGFTCNCPRCIREGGEKPQIPDATVVAPPKPPDKAAESEKVSEPEKVADNVTTSTEASVSEGGLPCHGCKRSLNKGEYSKKQLQKKEQRMCKTCTAATSANTNSPDA